jgi:hypothetical protein
MTPSLEKPTPIVTTCFKIEIECARYNVIDTFCL